jgi:hypothetical protein
MSPVLIVCAMYEADAEAILALIIPAQAELMGFGVKIDRIKSTATL